MAKAKGAAKVTSPEEELGNMDFGPVGNTDIAHIKEAEFKKIPMSEIVANPWNPNEMDEATFNMLVGNITDVGMNQPILVTPLRDDKGKVIPHKYRIIDGEQRFTALKLTDISEVPCMVVEKINEDEQKFQTLRMNKLRGDLNKQKFQAMVQKLIEAGHSIPDLSEKMGFTDEDEFRSLVDDVSKGMKGKMKKEFDKVKDEIKTIDDLTLVLNKMFSTYGDTLPYHYMVFDFGGKSHLWLRMGGKEEQKKFLEKMELCQEHNVTVDSAILLLMELGLNAKFLDHFKDQLSEPDKIDQEDALNSGFLESLGELEDDQSGEK